MPHAFTWSRRVEFADTDAAGVVHFSAYLRYMEEAEHAFYRSLGGLAFEWRADGEFGMPRISVRCDYERPLRHGDTVVVRLIVREKRTKSVRYEVELFRAADAPDADAGFPDPGERVARGSMTVVCAVRPHGAREWRSVELPEPLRRGLEVAPP